MASLLGRSRDCLKTRSERPHDARSLARNGENMALWPLFSGPSSIGSMLVGTFQTVSSDDCNFANITRLGLRRPFRTSARFALSTFA